jgi:hypothetical protein
VYGYISYSFTLDIFKTSTVADPKISKSRGPAPLRGAHPSKNSKKIKEFESEILSFTDGKFRAKKGGGPSPL